MSRLLTLCLTLLASLLPATALACSCMGTTIETRYERSENVFSAVITSIEFVECERRHPQIECSDWEAGFEVTQQFKGGTPFERISSHVGGASCGTSLTVGEEYLFFMGDTGKTGLCSGTITTTLADGGKNPGLALIEDFVAGRTPDLSSPWHSAEYDGLCSLRTDFPIPSGRDYPFTGGLHAEYRRAEPEQARAELGETGDVGFADLRVWLPIGRDPAGASAQLSIADREFALDWYQDSRRIRGSFGLRGAAAREFFELLTDPGTIRVTGTSAHVAEIDSEIRTTHAGTAIDEFLACMTLSD